MVKTLEQGHPQLNQCPSINVSFALNGKQLPADHGYLVYSAISKSSSLLHGIDWLAIELISGFPSGRGLISLLVPQHQPKRALDIIDAVAGLSEVAGNQSRFLYDFAPDSVVFRWTDDFAPRVLYGFEMDADANLSFPAVLQKVKTGDVAADELYIGGSIVERLSDDDKELLHQDGKGAFLHEGVKATVEKLRRQVRQDLGV